MRSIYRSTARALRTGVAIVALGLTLIGTIRGQNAVDEDHDWPQFRGSGVDGGSSASGVFSVEDPFSLGVGWQRDIGQGYSSVSIQDGVAVTMFESESDGRNVVAAFDVDTGEERWRSSVGDTYVGPDGSFNGPAATPLLAGSAVIALGRRSNLVGLDLASGDQLWSLDLALDYQARHPRYGVATSPVLANGAVIVQVGGPETALGALDPATGRWLWTVGGNAVNYQTPVPARLAGREQLLVADQVAVRGIDATSGDILWRYEHGGRGLLGASSLVPVPVGPNRVFLAHDNDESTLLEVNANGNAFSVGEVWRNRNIRNSYTVPVYHDGYLYGYGSRFLTCVDATTGESVWRSRTPGDGFLTLVDEHLVILTKDGTLHVAEASPDGYTELAALDLFDELTWTPPSFADGYIFARSQGTVARVDIRRTAQFTDATGAPDTAGAPVGEATFARFVADVESADSLDAKVDRINRYLSSFERVSDRGGTGPRSLRLPGDGRRFGDRG